jgi:hypothetical protein
MFNDMQLKGRGQRPALGLAVASLVCLAALASPAMAEMYKWVDADGKVHYTQERPPPGIKGDTIKPPPPVDSEAAAKQLEARQELLKGAQEGREKSAGDAKQAAEDKAFNDENCRRAKQTAAAYQVPNALVSQPDGSRKRYTEDERQKGLAEAEGHVKEFCK